MKPPYLILILWLFSTSLIAQQHFSPVAEDVIRARAEKTQFTTVNPLTPIKSSLLETEVVTGLSEVVSDYEVLDYTPPAFDAHDAPATIRLRLPSARGELEADLVRAQVLTDDFTLITSESNEQAVDYTAAVHYRGVLKDDPTAIVAVSFLDGEMMGIINRGHSSMVIGRLEGDKRGRHLLYEERDLTIDYSPECGTESHTLDQEDQDLINRLARGEGFGVEKSSSSNCVRVYLELEYDLVQEKGGANGALNFISGLWNVVATLYQVENIATQVSQVFTWTTPDTYPTGGGTGSALGAFRQARPNFNGDLAHLISRGQPTGGGVAYLDGLCNGSGYAYSYIYPSYAQLPTYSWTVSVLAHEMGHNLGSPHTHDCVWNNNNTAIDGCGPAAGYGTSCGGPLPSNGGTVMSYCHLVGSVGINFNNGFGQQPGDLMRAKVTAATCLSSCSNSGCPLLTFSVDNIDCHGGNDGSATVNPQGGTPPYSYAWSNGATTATITNLTAGFYSVTVTDGANCAETGTVSVSQPAQLSVFEGKLDASPYEGGTCLLNVNGGNTPYTFNWSNGATTRYVDNLASGTYFYTITDATNCVYTDSITVHDRFLNCSDNVLRITIKTDDFPRETGFALVTDQYVYLDQLYLEYFTPPNTTLTRTYCLPDGCYAFGIQDGAANGLCNSSSTGQGYYLLEDVLTGDTIAYECDFLNWNRADFCFGTDPLTLSATTTEVSCNGGTDGSATVTAAGGTGTYAYDWSNGGTTSSINGLTPGNYTVVVTSGWYVDSVAVTVGEPSALGLSVSGVDAVNGQNGSATALPGGGTQPYAYAWSNGGATSSINGLTPGNYGVTVTDANGCQVVGNVTLNDTTSGITLNLSGTDVSCKGGADGSATVGASGGTGSFTYSWSNGATTPSISSLSPGTYIVTVTSGNQTATGVATVGEPGQLFVTVGTTAATFGNADGTASSTVSGGTPPYSYLWSTGATTTGLTGLTAGTYSLTVTDANGCDRVTNFQVGELVPPVNLSFAGTDAGCFGDGDGTAQVTATGGTGSYTYAWSTGGTTATVTNLTAGVYHVTVTSSYQTAGGMVTIGEPTALTLSVNGNDSAQGGATGHATAVVGGGTTPYTYAWSNGGTTAVIQNLAAGTYTVTVTDANGCTTNGSVTIGEIEPGLELYAEGTDVSCNGGNDGTAFAQPSGGNGTYAYAWSNGATTATLGGLSAGTYFVTVTSGSQTNNGVVVVNEPSALTLSLATAAEVNGNDGSATATVGGGTPPYAYAWSNGGTTATIGGLAAGTYSLVTTDANGCTATGSATVDPPAPQLVFERGQLTGVGDSWQPVVLTNTYVSPVVIATPVIPGTNFNPVVTRVRNAGATGFELKVQRPNATTNQTFTVEYFVVEEGVYDQSIYGVTLEAVRASSNRTAARSRWGNGYQEARSYQQTYNNPVVLGQVMSENDGDWSVFWASANGSRSNAPNASGFAAGKQVAEDGDRTRANETVGYIVLEAGAGTIGGLDFLAGVGPDIVVGQQNANAGVLYAANNFNLAGGVLSSAGMDGNDGGWPVFSVAPAGPNGFRLLIEEDQIRDTERRHTSEEVAYLVFGTATAQVVAAATPAPTAPAATPTDDLSLDPGLAPLVFPNPTQGRLHFAWQTDANAKVKLVVSDLSGRHYRSLDLTAAPDGRVRETLELPDLPHGVYLLRVRTDREERTLRFVVTR